MLTPSPAAPEWVRQARMDRAMEMIARAQVRGDWETAAKWMAEYIKEVSK